MKFNQFAIATKLANPNGVMSLSNVAVMASIIQLAALPNAITIIAFALALLNYNAKKFNIYKNKKADEVSAAEKLNELNRINRMEMDVKNLISAAQFKNMGR